MSTPQLRNYTVRYEHNHGYSEMGVRAESLQAALEQALDESPRASADFCEYFEVDMRDFDYVHVIDDDTDEEILWQAPEERLRQAAEEMLKLLQQALRALNQTPQFVFDDTNSKTLLVEIDAFMTRIAGGAE